MCDPLPHQNLTLFKTQIYDFLHPFYDGGTEEDVEARCRKAQAAFFHFKSNMEIKVFLSGDEDVDFQFQP